MAINEEMKSCIQEWMAQALDAVELAKTYAEIKQELDLQLEFCMSELLEGADNE